MGDFVFRGSKLALALVNRSIKDFAQNHLWHPCVHFRPLYTPLYRPLKIFFRLSTFDFRWVGLYVGVYGMLINVIIEDGYRSNIHRYSRVPNSSPPTRLLIFGKIFAKIAQILNKNLIFSRNNRYQLTFFNRITRDIHTFIFDTFIPPL